MKVRYLVAALSVVSIVLIGVATHANAADEWFVLSEKVLKTADPSVEIKSARGSVGKGRQAGEAFRRGR